MQKYQVWLVIFINYYCYSKWAWVAIGLKRFLFFGNFSKLFFNIFGWCRYCLWLFVLFWSIPTERRAEKNGEFIVLSVAIKYLIFSFARQFAMHLAGRVMHLTESPDLLQRIFVEYILAFSLVVGAFEAMVDGHIARRLNFMPSIILSHEKTWTAVFYIIFFSFVPADFQWIRISVSSK